MKKLYLLLLIAFIGSAQASTHKNESYLLDASVAIFYPSPICLNSEFDVTVIMSGTGNYLGGTFTSTPGLVINPVTGTLSVSASVPGNYVITYTVPADPVTGEPGVTALTTVTIVPPVIPALYSIAPICYGSNPPLLPSMSLDLISGTWLPSAIDNTTTLTYLFIPNPGQCAVGAPMTIEVSAPVNPLITTLSGLTTVYVDDSNAVVLPLTLSLDTPLPDGFTYQWFVDGILISGATVATYTVATASATASDRTLAVEITNIETGCSELSDGFVVFQSNGAPPPSAPRMQTLASGATLADLDVTGTDIKWYDSADNKNANATALPLSTVLIDNTTYYATQMVDGEESLERLPVTVLLTLGVGGNELASLIYSPNPVKNSLIIKMANTINSVSIYNISGKVLKTTTYNQDQVVENLSGFSTGIYFIRVASGNKTGVFKIVKE